MRVDPTTRDESLLSLVKILVNGCECRFFVATVGSQGLHQHAQQGQAHHNGLGFVDSDHEPT